MGSGGRRRPEEGGEGWDEVKDPTDESHESLQWITTFVLGDATMTHTRHVNGTPNGPHASKLTLISDDGINFDAISLGHHSSYRA